MQKYTTTQKLAMYAANGNPEVAFVSDSSLTIKEYKKLKFSKEYISFATQLDDSFVAGMEKLFRVQTIQAKSDLDTVAKGSREYKNIAEHLARTENLLEPIRTKKNDEGGILLNAKLRIVGTEDDEPSNS